MPLFFSVRFYLFYTGVVVYRVFRIMFRPKITGDTNVLSTPISTMNRIVSDPILPLYDCFVDVGCGEGIIGVFMQLIKGGRVILHDIQRDLLTMIRFLCTVLRIKQVKLSQDLWDEYPKNTVFFCVWTSWTPNNRQNVLHAIVERMRSGDWVVLVSHGVNHPKLEEVKVMPYSFAWGQAKVYYYKYA